MLLLIALIAALQIVLLRRRITAEPGLALCGFDSNPARRDLATARFLRVVESGLGGTANSFDTISLHTFPNPRPAEELWPDLAPADAAKLKEHEERLARENAGYARLGGDECGRYELAGKSIAVPFVGAAAAALVVAETLRLLHRGCRPLAWWLREFVIGQHDFTELLPADYH